MYYIGPTIDGNAFNVTTDFISIGTTETYAVLIDNPSSSTKRIVIGNISLGSNISILTEGKVIFKIYSGPTVTSNGTVLSINNMKPSSSNTSLITIYKNPSVSSKGTLFISRIFLLKSNSDGPKQALYLEPGQKLLLTAESSTTANFHFDINWLET